MRFLNKISLESQCTLVLNVLEIEVVQCTSKSFVKCLKRDTSNSNENFYEESAAKNSSLERECIQKWC